MNILRFNRRNWKAVVLCISGAMVFWFFNALNKTYTTNINFPLSFDYDHSGFVPVHNLPQHVRINVTGNGWDLFKRSTGLKAAPLEIPLERPSEIKKIVGSTVPLFVSGQIEGLQINFVLTDTLYLDLEPRASRWINVVLDSVELNIRKGFSVASEVSVVPDSVFIEGPERLIVGFQEPARLRLRQRNIDETFMEDVEINILSSSAIRRNPATVAVMFDVEKTVILHDSARIVIENIPPTVSRVEAKYVPLTVAIPENKVKQFHHDSLRAVLNLANFKRGNAKIWPRIEGLPPFTKIIKLDTVSIRL